MLIDEYGVTMTPSKEMYVDFESIAEAYIDTMTCMGMTTIGPKVVEWQSRPLDAVYPIVYLDCIVV